MSTTQTAPPATIGGHLDGDGGAVLIGDLTDEAEEVERELGAAPAH